MKIRQTFEIELLLNANYRLRVRGPKVLEEHIGRALEEDWRTGGGLEDWRRIGAGLEQVWRRIGDGLEGMYR